jgi:hypothetical protein
LRFITEEDFYPLVEAYLHGRVPKVQEEYAVEDGWIDFRVGNTTNPAYLELAVSPRQLLDRGVTDAVIGEKSTTNKTALYGSQNKTELQKLSQLGHFW